MPKPVILEKDFYILLAIIHEEVADMACGCMGSEYTPERVEREDKHITQYFSEDGRRNEPIKYAKADKPMDYIGNILRKFILVIEGRKKEE